MSRYIDADALIEMLHHMFSNSVPQVFEENAYDIISYAPSIDIEPKRGKWIYGEHDIAMCDGYRCDRCGFFVPWDYEHKFIDFINDYNFCPNCGADMRERKESE